MMLWCPTRTSPISTPASQKTFQQITTSKVGYAYDYPDVKPGSHSGSGSISKCNFFLAGVQEIVHYLLRSYKSRGGNEVKGRNLYTDRWVFSLKFFRCLRQKIVILIQIRLFYFNAVLLSWSRNLCFSLEPESTQCVWSRSRLRDFGQPEPPKEVAASQRCSTVMSILIQNSDSQC